MTPGDEYTVAADFLLVEDIDTGAHAGTHLDVPAHFIEGARTVDELAAEEFVWPVYKIDVRGRSFPDNFIEVTDIEAYEDENGGIPAGALVVLQTGAERFWGAEEVLVDADDNAVNVDDFFDFENPGFSGDAVQWLFDERSIDGVGSDAYGPDAAGDELFDATYTTLANDGVALVALANLDAVNVQGDIIIASVLSLSVTAPASPQTPWPATVALRVDRGDGNGVVVRTSTGGSEALGTQPAARKSSRARLKVGLGRMAARAFSSSGT